VRPSSWLLVAIGLAACSGAPKAPLLPPPGGDLPDAARPVDASPDAVGMRDGGSAIASAVATSQHEPFRVVVDDTKVYWTNQKGGTSGTGAIMSANKDGSGVTEIARANLPLYLALDATSLYWSDTGSNQILAVDKDGSNARTIASAASPTAVAIDGSDVYWYYGTKIGTAKRDGSGVHDVVSDTSGTGQGLAVDDTHLYWTTYRMGGALVKANKDGTGATALATGEAFPWGIALDDTSIYLCIYGNGAAGAMVRMAKDGTNRQVLGASIKYQQPGEVVVDDTRVFWTDSVGIDVAFKDGTGGEVFAAANEPGGIAIDANSVYWTEILRGVISRASK
jgi:hypothetical protein